MIQTDYSFTLPIGLLDKSGQLHKDGSMRLANARDEILTLIDPNVKKDEAFIPLVLLSRVVTHIGEVLPVTPALLGRLFTADLAYLQDMYLRINANHSILLHAACPHCQESFQIQVAPLVEMAETV